MVYTSLLVKGEIFQKKFQKRVYVPFYKMKNFLRKKNLKKISEDGGCLEVGLWRGTGVSGW